MKIQKRVFRHIERPDAGGNIRAGAQSKLGKNGEKRTGCRMGVLDKIEVLCLLFRRKETKLTVAADSVSRSKR